MSADAIGAATAVYGGTFNGALSLKALTYFSDGDLPNLNATTQKKLRDLAGQLQRLKERGYKVHFFFLWVKSVDVALARVKDRVVKGGHDVPEVIVRRRFERSVSNFCARYRPLADSWYLFDNSGKRPFLIAIEKNAGFV